MSTKITWSEFVEAAGEAAYALRHNDSIYPSDWAEAMLTMARELGVEEIPEEGADAWLAEFLRSALRKRHQKEVYYSVLMDGMVSDGVRFEIQSRGPADSDNTYLITHIEDVGEVSLTVSASAFWGWCRTSQKLGMLVSSITLGSPDIATVLEAVKLAIDLHHQRIRSIEALPERGGEWPSITHRIVGEYLWDLYLTSTKAGA
jgi:hypothetical protein